MQQKNQEYLRKFNVFLLLWQLSVIKQGPDPRPSRQSIKLPTRNASLRKKTKKTQCFLNVSDRLRVLNKPSRGGSYASFSQVAGAHHSTAEHRWSNPRTVALGDSI